MTDKQADIQREIYQAIIATAIDGIITINTRGIVLSMNEAACRLFGYSSEEVIGKNIKILMPEPDKSNHDGYIAKYTQTGIPKIIGIGREVIGQKKSGQVFPFRLAVSEVKTEHGEVVFAGIIHDLSEVRRAQDEILELNKNLEDKVKNRTNELQKAVNKLLTLNKNLENEILERQKVQMELNEREAQLNKLLNKEKELGALKSRFVALASHEFRTPLTTINSSASLIAKYKDSDQQEKRVKHVDRIRKSVAHLNSVLNDFLSISRLEEGKLTINKESHDILELCRQVIKELKTTSDYDRDIVIVSIGESRMISTDKNIFTNIVFNLTTNALKYSEKEVLLEISFLEQEIELKVVDHGIGIPMRDQKHLFSRFFRASNALNIKGTGLGLNIVKTYVDMLEGELSFESVENRGSTFRVKIPTEV